LKAKYIGKSENMILRESAQEFKQMFYTAEAPPAGASKSQLQTYQFRSTTAQQMDNLVNALKNIGAPVKREVVSIKGGC
jgi:hypothetical protein